MNTVFKNNSLSKILLLMLILATTFSPAYKAEAIGDVVGSASSSIASCLGAGAISNALAGGLSSFSGIFVPTKSKSADFIANTGVTKSCVLDGTANGIKRILVRSLVQDTVDWINSGFNGKPSYGANLGKIFEDTKSKVIDEIIYNNKSLQHLCTGFELPIKFALQAEFYNGGGSRNERYTPKCTIDDIEQNFENAVDDVEKFYSWNKFLETTTNPDNNAFGVYFKLSKDAQTLIDKRNIKFNEELKMNDGFFSFRKCKSAAWQAQWRRENNWKEGMVEPNYNLYDASELASAYCTVTTTGKTLSSKLDSALNAEGEALVSADEFDEIIQALFNQLLKGLFEGGAAGLGDSSYANQIEDPALDSYKGTYIKQYDTRAYNIALKILESRKKTAENAQKVLKDTQKCWDDKKALKEQNEHIYRLKEGLIYENLSDATIENSVEYISENYIGTNSEGDTLTRPQREIAIVQNKIKYALGEKEKSEDIVELIRNAKTFTELTAVVNDAEITPSDIQGEIQQRDYVNGIFENMVNGALSTYPNRVGGLAHSSQYCSEFVILDTPISTEENQVSIIASQSDVNSMTSSRIINIVDTYDPAGDLYDLENSEFDIEYIPSGEANDVDDEDDDEVDSRDKDYVETRDVAEGVLTDKAEIRGYYYLKNNEENTRKVYFMIGSDQENLSANVAVEINKSDQFQYLWEGLIPGTTYYYKAMLSDGEGKVLSKGELKEFKTVILN